MHDSAKSGVKMAGERSTMPETGGLGVDDLNHLDMSGV